MLKKWLVLSMFIFAAVALFACSQTDQGSEDVLAEDAPQLNPSSQENEIKQDNRHEDTDKIQFTEPVTLTFLTPVGTTQEMFMDRYGHLIVEKYPNFSFEVIPATNDALDSLVIGNTKIDLIMSSFNQLRGKILPLNLLEDMSDLIVQHQFDLERIEPAYIDMIRNLDDGGVSAFPLFDQRVVMFYNNELFDRFGEEPPVDGMTWDEALALARKMTREEDGVQYRGFAASPTLLITVNQLSLDFVHWDSNEPTINNEAWQNYISTFLPFYQVPGYDPVPEVISPAGAAEQFLQEKTAALYLSFNGDHPREDHNMDWDAVTLPEFADKPGIGSQPYPVYAAVSSVSEQRNEAFAALEQLLSNEAQSWLAAEMGFPAVLQDPDVKAAFAQSLPEWEGKNIHAIGAQIPATPPNNVKFVSAYAQQELDYAMQHVILGEKDVNTALRDAEQAASQHISEYLAR